MTRLLPAHLLALALCGGLATANLARLHGGQAVALSAVLTVGVAARTPPRLVVTGVALMLGGWWWGTVRLDALDRSPLLAEVGRAEYALVVTTADARHGLFTLRAPGTIRRFGAIRMDERVELELPLGRAPPQGTVIDTLAVVRLPRGPQDGFDERTWLRRRGVHVVLKVDEWHAVGRRGGLGGLSDRLRTWLRRASAPGLAGERRAVLEGVLLGDDDSIPPGLRMSFRRSGLYHLLAVSGQNVVFVAAGLLALAWLIGLPRRVGHLAALGGIAAYVLAVGPQPSVIRAGVAGAVASLAWLVSRERDPWYALILAAVVLLAWNPYLVLDAGFQLSFAAVGAIFLLAPTIASRLEEYPLPRKVALLVAISTACSIVTAPILWLQFGSVPLLGVLANALAEPAVGPLLGLGLVTAAVDPVAPTLAHALAWVNGWIAAYVALCARAVGAIPFAQANGRAAPLALAGLLLAAAYARRRWRTS